MMYLIPCLKYGPVVFIPHYFFFRDKDKKTFFKASFQPHVSDSYCTAVLPCREYFKENDCHTHDNLSKKTGQDF